MRFTAREDEFISKKTPVEIKKQILPEGKYKAHLINVLDKISKVGNPMLVFKFEISKNRQYIDYHCITENGKRWNLKIAYESLTGNKWGNGQEIEIEPMDIIGKPVMLDLVIGEYNGEPQNKIKGVYPYAGEEAPF